jgi:DNA excision repair protein ERCC-2
MLFPFNNIRKGQYELIKDVEKALESKTNLIANAPSGIGKTAATLCPSLEYALLNEKTVFFLTPKHSQHKIVIDTLRRVKEKFKISFNAIDIIGKKWLCPVSGIELLSNQDFNEYCATMKKNERCIFYNNTRESGDLSDKAIKIVESILSQKPLHAEEIKHLCKGFCPYEIAIEVAKDSSVIVCDYYHIFSLVREKLLSRINKYIEDSIIIVDEAHNLPDRIRNILSFRLSNVTLKNAEKEARRFDFSELVEKVSYINEAIENLRVKRNVNEFFVEKHEFIKEIERIDEYHKIIEELEIAAEQVREERKRSFLGSIARFLYYWEGEDDGYARIFRVERDGDKEKFSLNYICLDPIILSKDIQDAHSIILMSGTLNPPEMYRDILGFRKETLCRSYKSSFPPENRLNLFIPDTTTEYKNRNEENFRKISNYLIRICSSVKGNIAIFFPSYDFRDKIYFMIKDSFKDRIIFLEIQNSSKEEKMKMLNSFMKTKNAILLGIQGGSFSEGVDFFGGILKCVVIVGLSLSKPDLETKSLINYYEKRFGKGREYGYIYPAIRRALQAAGRCIRSEEDRAVVIFMDKRFLWKNYRIALPIEMEFKVTKDPETYIKKFFECC